MEVKIYNDKTQNSASELRENKQININQPTSSNLLNDPLDSKSFGRISWK